MMPAHPGLLALGMPWESGQQYKRDMTLANRAAAYIVLARDSGEGRITLYPHGDPIITYWPNALDRKHLTRGMQEVTRIALAGAPATSAPPCTTPDAGGPARRVKQTQTFLDEIDRRGVEPNRLILGTAHQMGTCRLGGSAKTAVASPMAKSTACAAFSSPTPAPSPRPRRQPDALDDGDGLPVAQHIKARS